MVMYERIKVEQKTTLYAQYSKYFGKMSLEYYKKVVVATTELIYFFLATGASKSQTFQKRRGLGSPLGMLS